VSEPRVLVWLLIEQEGAALLGQRKPDREPFAGAWILPGDTMRDEESASETIERFGREQLDIEVGAEEFAETLFLSEDGEEYAVNIFRVSPQDRPRFRESGPYENVRWLTPADLADRRTYPAPEPLRDYLRAALGGTTER
jgi:ADP-ribose pyrophosphatase YjhB (NUDIX family)